MSAMDDLERKVYSLRDQLRDAEEKWHRAKMADHYLQPGDIVARPSEPDKRYLVDRLVVRYDTVRALGKPQTKTGWHGTAREFDWRGDLVKVAP